MLNCTFDEAAPHLHVSLAPIMAPAAGPNAAGAGEGSGGPSTALLVVHAADLRR